VVAHRRGRPLGIAGREPVRDGLVATVRAREVGGGGRAVVPAAGPGVGVDGPDDRAGEGVPRSPHDDVVEHGVRRQVGLRVIQLPAELTENRADLGQLGVVHPDRRVRRHHGFQGDADLHEVVEDRQVFVIADSGFEHDRVQQVPLVLARHRRALALAHMGQPLLLHQPHRLADDRPADAEGGAQLRLRREHGAGGQPAAHDLAGQVPDDPGGQPGRAGGPGRRGDGRPLWWRGAAVHGTRVTAGAAWTPTSTRNGRRWSSQCATRPFPTGAGRCATRARSAPGQRAGPLLLLQVRGPRRPGPGRPRTRLRPGARRPASGIRRGCRPSARSSAQAA
jgi:hypothetical protein